MNKELKPREWKSDAKNAEDYYQKKTNNQSLS